MKKKALSLALALALCLGLTVPAFAAEAATYEDEFYHLFRLTNVQQVAEEWNGLGLGLPITCYKSAEITTIADVTYFHAIPLDEDGNNGEEVPVSNLIEFDCPPHPEKFIKAGAKITLSQPGWYQVFAGICTDDHQPKGNGGGELDGVDFFITVLDEEAPSSVQPQPSVKTANPSNDKLTVNGVEATPTVYNIDNSNYFKIRDVAALLNGTEKQFSVGYDGEKQSVTATTGQGYDKLPTDLAGAPAGAGEAKASGDAIYVNGAKITPEVYNINGNNYFKLRDLGEALDFYIGWSLERGVYIETDKPYAG